jgi:hypothetical protein
MLFDGGFLIITLLRFLTAPNSRARLYTSRTLLVYILSYHQVMPSFLDFLFPFGSHEGPRDLNFSGFRQESRLEPFYSRLELAELGRSGRELRMCYNLKAVEPSEYQPDMPWSIRQTAVYHSLDVVTGSSFWIIVKGDELVRERIEAATVVSGTSTQLDDLDFRGNPFAASLATHMVICDWCSESWRWYISFLEEVLSEKTRYFFAVTLQPRQRPNRQAGPLGAFGSRSRFNTNAQSQLIEQNMFSFTNFLEVQSTEDRANEVRLVLESNISILTKLQEHYNGVILSEHCPESLIFSCKIYIDRFQKRLSGIINDLQMQQSRTANLLRLVADRKNMVCSKLINASSSDINE